MPIEIARMEVDRQIEDAVGELEEASAQGRVNIFLAQMAGSIATLVHRPDLTSRLTAVISGLTVKDLLSGSITNIDQRDFNMACPVELPPRDRAGRQHPKCDDDSIIDHMKAQGNRHVQLCLQGDIEGAVLAAASPLALEDIGCSLAALGQFDRAAAFMDAQKLNDAVKAQIHFVILLEKCRRGLPDFMQAIDRKRHQGYERLHIILALAGRLPWIGYPYSDS